MKMPYENFPQRPAWTEIDLGSLRRNLHLIRADLPPHVKLLAVVKDEAYGHGAADVARIALEEGAWGFGLSTLEAALPEARKSLSRFEFGVHVLVNDDRRHGLGAGVCGPPIRAGV